MRFVVSIVGLASIVATACVDAPRDANGTSMEIEQQRVLAVEDAYAAAEVSRDEAALRRLVDDQFVYNSGNGTISGKDVLIRNVLSMNMTGQTLSERSVMIEGEAAVIFGTTELRFQDPGGEPRLAKLRYTSVYVKRDDEWRMLALQMQPRSSP